MKTFDDFLKSMSDEDWENIMIKGVIPFTKDVKIDKGDLLHICLNQSCELLRYYHNWLNGQY